MNNDFERIARHIVPNLSFADAEELAILINDYRDNELCAALWEEVKRVYPELFGD